MGEEIKPTQDVPIAEVKIIEADIYEPGGFIGDFYNEYSFAVDVGDDGKIVRKKQVRTFEERYSSDWYKGSDVLGEVREICQKKPGKVARINKMVGILNSTQDVVELKRALNELDRLLYGKGQSLRYKEEEFNPDLLEA